MREVLVWREERLDVQAVRFELPSPVPKEKKDSSRHQTKCCDPLALVAYVSRDDFFPLGDKLEISEARDVVLRDDNVKTGPYLIEVNWAPSKYIVPLSIGDRRSLPQKDIGFNILESPADCCDDFLGSAQVWPKGRHPILRCFWP